MTDPRTPQPAEGTEATQEIHHQPRAQQPPAQQPPAQQPPVQPPPAPEEWWSEPGAAQPRPAPPRPAEQPTQVWTPPDEVPPRPEPPRFQSEQPRPEPPRGQQEPPRPDFAREARGQAEPPFEPQPHRAQGEQPHAAQPRDPRAQGQPPFEPPRGQAEPRREPRPPHEVQAEAPTEFRRPEPPRDPRGQGEPPRPPVPPRGPRPPAPPVPPEGDAERTQLIPPIRPDAPPPAPPRAAPRPAPEELTMPIPRIPARPRLDEQETELIPRIDDYDQYADFDQPEPEPEPEPEPKGAAAAEVPEPRRETGRVVVRTFGELLITAGLVVLLFVVYEVYVTDWLSAGKQANATSAMDDRWKNPNVVNNNEPQRTNQFQVGDGEGFAKVYIPAFGPDYVYTVLEGTSDKILEAGPGHYKGTAYPGEQGNFAVAGHRVGKGAPFNDIDLLESCDAIVVETQTDWYVYRMLPKTDEVKDWDKNKGADAKCKGVAPQGKGGKDDPYAKTVGQEIVRPEQGEVISQVPWRPNGAVAKDKQARLITLTTCHPRFSARQRLIVHGVLVRTQPKDPKDPKAVPAEFQTG